MLTWLNHGDDGVGDEPQYMHMDETQSKDENVELPYFKQRQEKPLQHMV